MSKHYLKGYADGCNAFSEAMAKARAEFGEPLLSGMAEAIV